MKKYFFTALGTSFLLALYLHFSRDDERLSAASLDKILITGTNDSVAEPSRPERTKSNAINGDPETAPTIPSVPLESLLMDEETSSRIRRESMIEGAGYSEEGAKAFERGDAIALKDMPESLQTLYQQELGDLKKFGYIKISEEDMSDIIESNNRLIGRDDDAIKNLRFKPSQLPEILKSKYQYKGYTFDPVSHSEKYESPSNTLRRIFVDPDTSSTILLEEEPLSRDFRSSLVKEFVNTEIQGRDAKFVVHKSPSERSYSMLTWSSASHVYTIFQYGGPSNKHELITIGSELTKSNGG